MSVRHDHDLSKPGHQIFWFDVGPDNEAEDNAAFRAWLAIGENDFGNLVDLTGHKKTKWHVAFQQAHQVEAIKLAYRHPAIVWLVQRDVKFDLNPFTNGWIPAVEVAEVRIMINDDDKNAMLFKLTFS